MAEKDIVAKIMKYLKSLPECFAWKEHGGTYGTSGLPDIICCYRGRFAAFEVKTLIGRVSKLQEVTIGKINAAGGVAVVVTSVDEVICVLNGLGGE